MSVHGYIRTHFSACGVVRRQGLNRRTTPLKPPCGARGIYPGSETGHSAPNIQIRARSGRRTCAAALKPAFPYSRAPKADLS